MSLRSGPRAMQVVDFIMSLFKLEWDSLNIFGVVVAYWLE
jgi:hypothetical protein